MYRFLLTPRWLGILAVTLAAAAGMVLLGNWQLHRYQERAATNDRIDATARVAPVPVADVLAAPTGGAGSTGPAPAPERAWTRTTATGRYDPANLILVRGRTVDSRVGFEVVVPLVLADGRAVLVDRGWVPPAPGGATARPQIPPTPTGEVTVVGRVHLSESQSGTVSRQGATVETRRIAVPRLAAELPYPVYGAYLLADQETPPAAPGFSAIPIRHENDWQNFGYVVQWWLFAAMALVGFGWLARREARGGGGAPAARQLRGTDRAVDTSAPSA
ncbi:MAG TPA: SURF1 family protein [Micromonospora sp.]